MCLFITESINSKLTLADPIILIFKVYSPIWPPLYHHINRHIILATLVQIHQYILCECPGQLKITLRIHLLKLKQVSD